MCGGGTDVGVIKYFITLTLYYHPKIKYCDSVRNVMPNILVNEMYTVLDPILTLSGPKALRPCMKNAKNAEKPRFLPNRVSF